MPSAVRTPNLIAVFHGAPNQESLKELLSERGLFYTLMLLGSEIAENKPYWNTNQH
jgi:hypothetical protein